MDKLLTEEDILKFVKDIFDFEDEQNNETIICDFGKITINVLKSNLLCHNIKVKL